jgi:hypothetical protein
MRGVRDREKEKKREGENALCETSSSKTLRNFVVKLTE